MLRPLLRAAPWLLVACARERSPEPTDREALSSPAVGEARASRFPARASEGLQLRAGSSAIGVRWRGAQAAAAHRVGDRARYPEALGEGTEVELRELADGVEDRVRFARAPEGEGVTYEVDVRRVAGVRQVGSVVEFVDEQGAPRLRMGAPWVETSTGERVAARVEVGCAHDESTRAPWGRAVVSPGVETCAIRVSWGGRGVTYPAVLDPAWTATGSMSLSRYYMGFGALSDGRLMVTGGHNCSGGVCTVTDTSEIYDLATGTWAQAAPLSSPRWQMSSLVVPGFGLMVVGGKLSGAVTNAERYDESKAAWVVLPPMTFGRQEPLLAWSSTIGRLVVAGGNDSKLGVALSTVEHFDPKTQSWSNGGGLVAARYLTRMMELPSGEMIIPGGTLCANCGPGATAELYNPASKSSVVLPSMPTTHFGHEVALMQIKGKPVVVVAGGGSGQTELFDVATKTWSVGPTLNSSRVGATSRLLSDGSLLIVGGIDVPSFEPSPIAERLNPVTLLWQSAGLVPSPHGLPASLPLPNDGFLVAGGVKGNFLNDADSVAATSLFRPLEQGQPCQESGECLSDFCADGVCCESACEGLCQACSTAKKGSGADGVCGFFAAGSDPEGDCPTDDPTTCGFTGSCDGKGQCARYPVGSACGAASCTDGVSSGLLCGADGKCAPQNVPCSPFLCQGVTCGTSCEADKDCAVEGHCEQGVCVGDAAVGAACDRASACLSGFCVDGVCCESACEGACRACLGEKKEGGGADGVCGFAKVDSDPHEDCADEPVIGCDRNGFCDGKGACARYAKGTSCQTPVCASNGSGSLLLQEFLCDGSGSCQQAEGSSCGLFGCEQGTCKESCAQDADCAPRAYCEGGVCLERKALGKTCGMTRECETGFCVDGVCCNGPCDGPCESCGTPSSKGLCVPVSGPPQGERAPCPTMDAGNPCAQRTCDGTVRESCQGFVGKELTCRPASCASGVQTLAASCDGKGSCPEAETSRCEPFVCSGTTCLASCTNDGDCNIRFQCDTAQGKCIPRTAAVCDGNYTLINPDGSSQPCAPYRCEGSVCKPSCASVLDCVQPSICDEETHKCVPPRVNPSEDGGCQMTPGPAGLSPLAALAALGWLARRRRRAS